MYVLCSPATTFLAHEHGNPYLSTGQTRYREANSQSRIYLHFMELYNSLSFSQEAATSPNFKPAEHSKLPFCFQKPLVSSYHLHLVLTNVILPSGFLSLHRAFCSLITHTNTDIYICIYIHIYYIDTSANEDNSFRNHIRQPKSSLAET